MNNKIIVIGIITMFLITSISSFTVIGANFENKIRTTNTEVISEIIVNIGTMTIGENFIDFAVNDKYVYLKPGIEEITIEAIVHFRLHGWCDHGYAYLGLWDEPPEDQADHGEEADVTLSFTINNCKPDDIFEIELKGKYTDCINPDFTKRKKCILTIKEVGDNPIYIGEMFIDGDGDPETAIVRSTSEQIIEIPVGPSGSDITLETRFEMNCAGNNDHGYVEMWVRGADSKMANTGGHEAGYLFTTVPDCDRGDTIEWLLTTTYYYQLPLPPIINVDGGTGICDKQFVKSERPTSLLLQFLERYIDQFQLVLSVLKDLANCLYNRTFIVKGTLICK